MNWIMDLVLARECNRSNVIVVDTLDPARYDEFIQAIKEGIVTCREQPYRSFMEVNLGECLYRECSVSSGNMSCSEWKSPMGSRTMVANPVAQLPALMNLIAQTCRSKPTLVVMRWLTETGVSIARDSGIVRNIVSYLVSWSQDSDFYVPLSEKPAVRARGYAISSTVIVFGDASLIPESAQKLMAVIRPPISTLEERKRVIEGIAKQIERIKGVKVPIEDGVAEVSSGLNLHEVSKATLKSIKLYLAVKRSVFVEAKREILRELGIEFVEPKRGFESVGGYDILKRYLIERVIEPIKHPELAEMYGEEIPRGLILYGYPGCGKTWLAMALAKEANVTMVKLNAADFLRGIVGETEQRIRRITKLLDSLAPIIVFIDEIDQLFMAREGMVSTDSGVSRRMVNMLLEWLGDENRRAFVIGATNYVEAMDRAALRPGRFDSVVLVLPPDFNARREILRIHLEVLRKPRVPIEVDYDEVARATVLWTGSELAMLVRDAVARARIARASKITTDILMEVARKKVVNLEERRREIDRMIRTAKSLEIADTELIDELNRSLLEEIQLAKEIGEKPEISTIRI